MMNVLRSNEALTANVLRGFGALTKNLGLLERRSCYNVLKAKFAGQFGRKDNAALEALDKGIADAIKELRAPADPLKIADAIKELRVQKEARGELDLHEMFTISAKPEDRARTRREGIDLYPWEKFVDKLSVLLSKFFLAENRAVMTEASFLKVQKDAVLSIMENPHITADFCRYRAEFCLGSLETLLEGNLYLQALKAKIMLRYTEETADDREMFVAAMITPVAAENSAEVKDGA
ncbi:MAG: hypothetical protein WCG04_06735 [Alphaproteobacteria bacterium]